MWRRTVCKQNSSSPCQLIRTALDGCARHSHPKQSAIQSSTQVIVKQHTVNPLITSDVNPFLPRVISKVSVLFYLQ
ncbi:unnamed protein product [Staurois parvus]|uniref:Uncharacterized protein n=1 Tax=Staurois parvus TaxID=386267 RepID=A0ABN9GHX4_9NEOB|nr:unnamed protein product [Staurois parvus]